VGPANHLTKQDPMSCRSWEEFLVWEEEYESRTCTRNFPLPAATEAPTSAAPPRPFPLHFVIPTRERSEAGEPPERSRRESAVHRPMQDAVRHREGHEFRDCGRTPWFVSGRVFRASRLRSQLMPPTLSFRRASAARQEESAVYCRIQREAGFFTGKGASSDAPQPNEN
jgi:hypothetical protein